MSKSGGTLYIGVPHSKFWGGGTSPQGLRLCQRLSDVSYAGPMRGNKPEAVVLMRSREFSSCRSSDERVGVG